MLDIVNISIEELSKAEVNTFKEVKHSKLLRVMDGGDIDCIVITTKEFFNLISKANQLEILLGKKPDPTSSKRTSKEERAKRNKELIEKFKDS